MNRNEFLKASSILGTTALLPAQSVFASNLIDNGIDKLVDADGNTAGQNVKRCRR